MINLQNATGLYTITVCSHVTTDTTIRPEISTKLICDFSCIRKHPNYHFQIMVCTSNSGKTIVCPDADSCNVTSASNSESTGSEAVCNKAVKCFVDGVSSYVWCPNAKYCKATNGGTAYCPVGTCVKQKKGICDVYSHTQFQLHQKSNLNVNRRVYNQQHHRQMCS